MEQGRPSTCMMTHGLYLKANLEMPCWDDVGEAKILRQLDSERLAQGRELELSSFDALMHIRQSFAQGRLPYPDLCGRCAVRGHGQPVVSMRPRTLEVLHVEPSYLCHLACPQCIAPKVRRSLKAPPYHLAPADFDAFLAQLKRESVEHIALVIFEGRGDPLSNQHIGELVAIAKRHYPKTFTSITTHGNIPFRPWIMECGLDLLRLSVDGAFPENYAKYRINGRLEMVLRLMRDIRDFPKDGRPRPSLEWKYILFEWNDSDEELAHAGRLAQELEVSLRFCRTHTPGRSLRYTDDASVTSMIARLAPEAKPDLTFQLKSGDDHSTVDVVRDDRIRARFLQAEKELDRRNYQEAVAIARDAVRLDPEILRPSTAMHLALFVGRLGHADLKAALLRRYLRNDPDSPFYGRIETELLLLEALVALQSGQTDRANEKLGLVLSARLGPRERWLNRLDDAVGHDDPGVISALANIAQESGNLPAADKLFRRYLELAPGASDKEATLARLRLIDQARAGSASALQAIAPPPRVASSDVLFQSWPDLCQRFADAGADHDRNVLLV